MKGLTAHHTGMKKVFLAVGVAILASGCATDAKVEAARRQPTYDAAGVIIGYEERIAGRTILFDKNGKPVGERWQDLRNDGTNPGNSGVSVIVSPGESTKKLD